MNRRQMQLAIVCLLFLQLNVFAQSQDIPKFEVGAEFTSLGRDSFGGSRMDAGFGGRFTFNLNENVALEAAGYFFPQKCFSCAEDGRMTQVVAGVKAGKRFEKWGIFAKARPGFVSFSEGERDAVITGPANNPTTVVIQPRRVTGFAMDVGGVLEFYPTKRIVTRFDAGDTIVHFGDRVRDVLSFVPPNGPLFVVPVPRPARTTHNFQFMAGVGFRF